MTLVLSMIIRTMSSWPCSILLEWPSFIFCICLISKPTAFIPHGEAVVSVLGNVVQTTWTILFGCLDEFGLHLPLCVSCDVNVDVDTNMSDSGTSCACQGK